MSFNRENVTWQNANGTWNMAFYVVAWVDPEGDEEWDVEYDYTRFEPYGYALRQETPDKAYAVATRDRANPGGTYEVPYSGNYSECERYSQMLRDAISREQSRREKRNAFVGGDFR